MFKVIIIEDEKPAARRLDRLLERNGVSSLVILHSVAESINWLQHNPQPDLIFLDVQLSDGLSFEIFESVNLNSAIIFTTAYDQYALKAFKLNSIDYLLKPIDEDELIVALQKFKNLQIEMPNVLSNISQLKEALGYTNKVYKKRFTVQVGQHLKIINTQSIECFYSEIKATFLSTDEGKSYPIDGSLEQMIDRLDPKLFFKVNRKFIIQLHAIKDIISYTNSRLQIKLNTYNRQDIIVSREKVKEFKRWIS